MSNLAESRQDIELEDVAYRASVSEAVANKIGTSINFINRRQCDQHAWHLNGDYALGAGSTGTDGIFVFLFDAEIVGFSYYNQETGTSGSTTVDVHWLSGGGTDEGSIFSTLPDVDSTASNGTYTVYDQINSTTLSNPTGHTLAVLSKTDFVAGDALRLDLDSAMSGADTFQLIIHYRPR